MEDGGVLCTYAIIPKLSVTHMMFTRRHGASEIKRVGKRSKLEAVVFGRKC